MGTVKKRGTFISYSHKDRDFVSRLAGELKSSGYIIWLDQWDIPVGEPWDDRVEKGLCECETFLIILTSASIASKNVKDEIVYAMNHGKRIVPVLLEKCELPLQLSRLEYIDFTEIAFIDGLKKVKQLLPSRRFEFWEGLSEKVMIVFGAIENPKKDKDGHSVISLRDYKAAQTIETFLYTHYPQKKVGVLAATTKGWQNLLLEDTDLIIVGGWVVNQEFKNHQSICRTSLRLKMGRLCRVKGQRVYHVKGDSDNIPMRSDPYEIEELSSREIKEDFGMVTDTREEIYGAVRRVISIAGIKGNGTLGAAQRLIQDMTIDLEKILSFGKEEYGRLELIVKSYIHDDAIYKKEIVEVILDGKPIMQNNTYWKACELQRSCEECAFGETIPKEKQ